MDEIEETNDDIDYKKLFFVGSNKENFNFNFFGMLFNFRLDIFNGKISLKKQKLSKGI